MGYTPQEFQTAFDKVSEKHSLTFMRACDIVEHFTGLWEANRRKESHEKRKFGEIIRKTLNDKGIWPESERDAYGSLIGTLYSPRAHAAKKHRGHKDTQKKVPVAPPPPPIIETPSGQYAWEI